MLCAVCCILRQRFWAFFPDVAVSKVPVKRMIMRAWSCQASELAVCACKIESIAPL